MKTILYLILFLFTSTLALAQHAHFTTSGSIEFQKSTNTIAILKKMIGTNMDGLNQQAFDQYKKTQPQFKTINSTLTFNNNKTLYTPVATESKPTGIFGSIAMADQNNLVYTDLETNSSTSQKTVLEEAFLVKDTVRKINWKITDETREIAGYTCRRANALVLDSIYVVAFYTDKIPVSGGPESFTGLPGMILLVALPHENVTWTATKITDVSVPVNTMIPPKKGKPVNNKEFITTIKSATKNWGGSYVKEILKAYLL